MEFIELNMDAGEGINNEKELLPFVQSVSIACGGHYGDEITIRQSILSALENRVKIGIHPSLPDTKNFGRIWWDIDYPSLKEALNKQWLLFKQTALELQASIHHVKWHGALYNRSSEDEVLASFLAELIQEWDPNLILYGQSATVQIEKAKQIGLNCKAEVFADRAYLANGLLAPRILPNSVLTDSNLIQERIQHFRSGQTIATLDGQSILLQAETICIHGDNPAVYQTLKS